MTEPAPGSGSPGRPAADSSPPPPVETVRADEDATPAEPPTLQTRSGDIDQHPTVAAPFEGNADEATATLLRMAGYEILGILGRGGMGVVYKARHLGLNRVVALKMILSGAHAGPKDKARFRVEARAVARLHHPHIVQVFDVGEENGLPFLALEYVPGGSLAARLDGKPIDPRLAAEIVELIARAVHHAHQRGIVHRDLKPANVLLDDPALSRDPAPGAAAPFSSPTPSQLNECVPKITDFGLAKVLDMGRGPTQGPSMHSQGVMGTPGYMAPEQALGKPAGPGADVHAMGVILYELLTGKLPYRGTTPYEVITQVVEAEPPPPGTLQPGLPRNLEVICLRCLAKDARHRYPSAEALADDLRLFLADQPIRTSGTLFGFRRRRRWALLASIAGAVVLAAAVWLMLPDHRIAAADRAVAAAVEAKDLGNKSVAVRHYGDAQDLYRQLAVSQPKRQEFRVKLAQAQVAEGDLWRQMRQWDEAGRLFDEAVTNLSTLATLTDATPDATRALAEAYHNRGILEDAKMHWTDALKSYQQAKDLREKLHKLDKKNRAFRRDLARSHGYIGDTQLILGRRPEAWRSYEDAAALRRELVKEDPADHEAKLQLARSLANTGRFYWWGEEADSHEEAAKAYLAALEACEDLVSVPGDHAEYNTELAENALVLTELLLGLDRPDEAWPLLVKAEEIYGPLAAADSRDPWLRSRLAQCALNRARYHAATDKPKAAACLAEFDSLAKGLDRPTADDLYADAASRALRAALPGGEPEGVWASLDRAVAQGFRQFARVRYDPAFRAVRESPDFAARMARLRQQAK